MTDSTETLTIDAFIEARLRQDEVIARAATPGPWRYDPTKEHVEINTGLRSEGVFTGPDGPDAICVATTGDSDDRPSMRDARFIARHDPERVLRQCEALRAIMRVNVDVADSDSGASIQIAEAIASIWSNHPDFRAEWSA